MGLEGWSVAAGLSIGLLNLSLFWILLKKIFGASKKRSKALFGLLFLTKMIGIFAVTYVLLKFFQLKAEWFVLGFAFSLMVAVLMAKLQLKGKVGTVSDANT